jgi:hypothetical protein
MNWNEYEEEKQARSRANEEYRKAVSPEEAVIDVEQFKYENLLTVSDRYFLMDLKIDAEN